MPDMEYRARITVQDLPLEAEDTWSAFLTDLERADLGAVLTWTADGRDLIVTVAKDCPDPAAAVSSMVQAVADSLRAVELGHLYPSGIELAPAPDLEAVA